MADRFLAPDLTQLAPAKLIEEIDAESILAEQKAFVLARWAEVRAARPDLPPLDTLGLETEPLTILLEAFAYRETLLRALVNDKARAVLLAYATGTDLDHIGALFATYRMQIMRASGSTPAQMESDERFRRRIQFAPEAFSCAGPRGAYIYYALGVDLSIVDAEAFSPEDGRVHVVVAAANGGQVSDSVIAKLVNRLRRDDTVPLTDWVSVRRAEVVDYQVTASVAFPRGPDPDLVRTRVEESVAVYAADRYRVGATVFRSGLIAAAQVGGVENVTLEEPATDLVCGPAQIAHLSGLAITTIVTD
jgi:phage-related baseplate assembly protein